MWLSQLQGRSIDFLKIDVDLSWQWIGVEKLIQRRGAKVVCFEVDGAWGGARRNALTAFDQFANLSTHAGYNVYMKVPCRARTRSVGSMESGSFSRATRLVPVAATGTPFVPTRFFVGRSGHNVQDFLLIQSELLDPSHAESLATLPDRLESDCSARQTRQATM